MSKPKDRPVSADKTPPSAVSGQMQAPKTALEFARVVRQIYSAAEYEPNLFYCLITPEDPETEYSPYAEVIEMLEVIIGSNPVFWEGSKEAGLEFLDMVIGLLEARV